MSFKKNEWKIFQNLDSEKCNTISKFVVSTVPVNDLGASC